MLVTEIISFPKMKEPLIQCKWYDPEVRETKTNIFAESKIQFFNRQVARKARIRYTTSELVSL